MSADMKSVKLRIKSVQNTMQITKAMQLVAASKLRKAKQTADNCRPYFEELHQTLIDIASGYVGVFSPYIKKEQDNDNWCYILIAGDRGMAGGYNSNMFKLFENKSEGASPVILPIGKRALEYAARKKYDILTENFAVVANISVADCFSIAHLLCGEYLKDKFEHIALCYTRCQTMLTQVADTFPILPLDDMSADLKTAGRSVQTIYDPNPEEVFNAVVPEYLAGLIFAAVCDSVASEYAARRNAMDAATKNAGDMLDQLSLHYNRARQASITNEITEIVAGAEGV